MREAIVFALIVLAIGAVIFVIEMRQASKRGPDDWSGHD